MQATGQALEEIQEIDKRIQKIETRIAKIETKWHLNYITR